MGQQEFKDTTLDYGMLSWTFLSDILHTEPLLIKKNSLTSVHNTHQQQPHTLDWKRGVKAVTVAGLHCLGLFSVAFHQCHSVSLFASVIDCESERVCCISSTLNTSAVWLFH